jgi:hypothetical protein
MISAMDTGLSLMRAGFGMFEAGMKFSEMLLASHSVIGTRVDLMNQAARNPLSGDYAELGRMVPEKMAAFTRSGAALADEWRKVQGDMFDQWREFGRLVSDVPTLGRLDAFGKQTSQRGARTMVRAMEASGRALEPVHKTATANARRLKRGKRKLGG